jgi:hypothetical protein
MLLCISYWFFLLVLAGYSNLYTGGKKIDIERWHTFVQFLLGGVDHQVENDDGDFVAAGQPRPCTGPEAENFLATRWPPRTVSKPAEVKQVQETAVNKETVINAIPSATNTNPSSAAANSSANSAAASAAANSTAANSNAAKHRANYIILIGSIDKVEEAKVLEAAKLNYAVRKGFTLHGTELEGTLCTVKEFAKDYREYQEAAGGLNNNKKTQHFVNEQRPRFDNVRY